MSPKHFIRFRDLPLLYGRVPKVANSSINAPGNPVVAVFESRLLLLAGHMDPVVNLIVGCCWREAHARNDAQSNVAENRGLEVMK